MDEKTEWMQNGKLIGNLGGGRHSGSLGDSRASASTNWAPVAGCLSPTPSLHRIPHTAPAARTLSLVVVAQTPALCHVSRSVPRRSPPEARPPRESASSTSVKSLRLSSGRLSSQFFRAWTPSMGLWGAGAGVAALYVRPPPPLVILAMFWVSDSLLRAISFCPSRLSSSGLSCPRCPWYVSACRRHIHVKSVKPDLAPVSPSLQIGGYWEDKTPASDKPF